MTVKHLIFDLDNTLYPATSKMDDGIKRRMIAFVADWLKTDIASAKILRAEGLPRYGTTLEWLIQEAGLKDIEAYFRAVHPEEEEAEVDENPQMRPFLRSLLDSSLTLSVLSNAPIEHVERVLRKLNIIDLFSHVTDIRACNFRGKPYKSAYETALNAVGGNVGDTLFFDDHIKYAEGFASLGGNAVLVGQNSILSGTKGFQNEEILSESRISGKIFHLSSIFYVKKLLQQISFL